MANHKYLLYLAFALLCGAVNATFEYFVVTEGGIVQGGPSPAGTHRAWNSIPYAKPPTGDRRWAPAQKLAFSPAIIDARPLAPLCPQRIPGFTGQEDCLYLSVFVPRTHNVFLAPLPVQIYVHGGSFLTGGAQFYNGEILSGKDVIFVAVNYRLGSLGFLNHPALQADASRLGSGMYGIQDQRAAFAWVQRNIRLFGGDPSRVTISGESAGAAAIQAHLAFPCTEGLFHRAILQSEYNGVGANATGVNNGLNYARNAGCSTGTNAEQLACLLAQNASTAATSITPTVGSLLTDTPINILRAGFGCRVPIFIGSNLNESTFLGGCSDASVQGLTADTYAARVRSSYAAFADAALAAFPASDYPNPGAAWIDIQSSRTFACAARNLSRVFAQTPATSPVYMYQLTDAPQFLMTPDSSQKYGSTTNFACFGSAHSFDLSYLFPTYWAQYNIVDSLTADEQVVRNNMRKAWSQFVINGVPKLPNNANWPQFTAASGTYVTIDNTFDVASNFKNPQCTAFGL